MTERERKELRTLRLRRAFCAIDRRYRKWDTEAEARLRVLQEVERKFWETGNP
jgi:hypothetical protein